MICCEQEVHKSLLPRFTKTTALTNFVERLCCLQTHDAVLHQCFFLLLVTWLKQSNLLITLTLVQDVKPPSMWHLDFLISYLISFFFALLTCRHCGHVVLKWGSLQWDTFSCFMLILNRDTKFLCDVSSHAGCRSTHCGCSQTGLFRLHFFLLQHACMH